MQRSLRDGQRVPHELAVRRIWQSLVERAHAGELGEPRQWRRWPIVALATALTLVIALGLWLRPAQRHAPPVEWPPSASVEAAPVGAADWSHEVVGEEHRIVLKAGALEVSVRRRTSSPKLVVTLPDGELEDVGTVFSVAVRDGKTSAIDVREGAVLFHRRGHEVVRIAAGERWRNREVFGAVDRIANDASTPRPADSAAVGSVATRGRGRAAADTRARVADARDDASAAEDSAYLQILALLREGRDEEAKIAAKGYLRRFPNGFRRAEVDQIGR